MAASFLLHHLVLGSLWLSLGSIVCILFNVFVGALIPYVLVSALVWGVSFLVGLNGTAVGLWAMGIASIVSVTVHVVRVRRFWVSRHRCDGQ